MTRIASTSSPASPAWLDWNACAVPPKLVMMLDDAGITCAACCSTYCVAVPSATPARRLNESVTEGTCPEWLTESGVTVSTVVVTELSGTAAPVVLFTYSRLRAFGSRWYCFSSSSTTQYWLVGV